MLASGGAPIFRKADYGVVGDLYAILPAIERAIAALAGAYGE